QEETKIIDTFVENISKSEFQISANTSTNFATVSGSPTVESPAEASVSAKANLSELAAETLNPIPEILATLIDLKEELPATEQAKINIAINIEVGLIQDHLVNQVNDPSTF